MAIEPKPSRDFIILLQRLLEKYADYKAGIDGIAGPGTIKAIESLGDIPTDWDRSRKIIAGIQSLAKKLNISKQPVDGIMGPVTEKLVQVLNDIISKQDEEAFKQSNSKINSEANNLIEDIEGELTATQVTEIIQATYLKGTNWWYNADEEFWAKVKPVYGHILTDNFALDSLQKNGIDKEPEKGESVIGFRQNEYDEVVSLFEVDFKDTSSGLLHLKFLREFSEKPKLNDLRSLPEFYEEWKDYAFYPIPEYWFSRIINKTELTLGDISGQVDESDKIPFHLDNVENIDRLNREPIAKSIARLINKEIFRKGRKVENAFMIHLQGAWGAGKSTFLNLIKKHLPDGKDWIVVDFNAWQNQHIDPPWWSFLVNVFSSIRNKLKWYQKPANFISESFRRFLWFNGYKSLATIVITLVLIWVLISIINKDWSISSDKLNDFIKKIDNDTVKFLIGISTLVGIIFSFTKFISAPLFLNSPNRAKSFMEFADDPMKAVKKHFEGILKFVNKRGYKLAIFIDDIDRCNAKFVVELLEGIQTLFKDKGVLYIVAGDRRWISTCFENHYRDYKGIASEPAQELGYLFLEKAFQLSIRLPKVSVEAKEEYWKYILNPEPEKDDKKGLSDEQRAKLMGEIAKKYAQSDLSKKETIDKIALDGNVNKDEALDMVLEVMDESKHELKHLLEDHYELIDSNPRSIKRLANEFTMNRNILTSEGKDFHQIKLFRWIIVQNKYPVFADWLIKNQDKLNKTDMWPENLQLLSNNKHLDELMYDSNDGGKDKLTTDDIANFANLGSV